MPDDNEISIEEYRDKPVVDTKVEVNTFIHPSEPKTAKDQLIKEILISLGYPLLQVELTPDQLDYVIDESLELYTKYASFDIRYLGIDLANYKEHEGINLKKFNISVIKDISFTPPSLLGLGTSELAFGLAGNVSNYPGYFWQSFDFVSLQCAHQFHEMAQRMLFPKPDWTFKPQTGMLQLFPEPFAIYHRWWNRGHWRGSIPAVVDCEIEPSVEELYANEYVKRLAQANAKVLLGTIRSKFTGINLPGGGQIDGATLRQEGNAELKELVDNIRSESYSNQFIIV